MLSIERASADGLPHRSDARSHRPQRPSAPRLHRLLSPRLRSRLRRGLLCTPLTSGNEFPHTVPGGVSGTGCLSVARVFVGRACHSAHDGLAPKPPSRRSLNGRPGATAIHHSSDPQDAPPRWRGNAAAGQARPTGPSRRRHVPARPSRVRADCPPAFVTCGAAVQLSGAIRRTTPCQHPTPAAAACALIGLCERWTALLRADQPVLNPLQQSCRQPVRRSATTPGQRRIDAPMSCQGLVGY